MCVLWSSVLTGTPAAGQGDEAAPWTLPRLVRYALDHNKGLAASRLATSVAQEGVRIAEGRRWPWVEAVSAFQYFPIRDRLLIERHGRRAGNPFQETVLNYGLQVTLPLYTGGRIPREISVAEAEVAASQSRSELTRQELIFNVTSVYYTYLRVRAEIEAAEALVGSVGESRRIALQQASVGRIARLDILRLEATLAQAESQLAVIRNDLDRTAATLTALLALPPDVPFRVVGDLTPTRMPWDANTARDRVLRARPDLATLRRQIDAQRDRIEIAAARQGPRLDASVFYGAATGEDTTSNDAKAFITLRIPLYTGDVLSAQKRQAFARLQELQARRAAAERQALAEVERALIELSSTTTRLEFGLRAIEQSEEALRVERMKFAEGRSTSNDLLLAEGALLLARTQYANAVAQNRIAAAALRLATGDETLPSE